MVLWSWVIYLTSVYLLFLIYFIKKYLCHQMICGKMRSCVCGSQLHNLPTVTQLINVRTMAWIHVQIIPSPCLWPLHSMPDKVSSGLNYPGRWRSKGGWDGRCWGAISHLVLSPPNSRARPARALEASAGVFHQLAFSFFFPRNILEHSKTLAISCFIFFPPQSCFNGAIWEDTPFPFLAWGGCWPALKVLTARACLVGSGHSSALATEREPGLVPSEIKMIHATSQLPPPLPGLRSYRVTVLT